MKPREEKVGMRAISRARAELTKEYEKGPANLDSEEKMLAYLRCRTPATQKVLERVLKEVKGTFTPYSFLDIGSGPGSSFTPIKEAFSSIKKIFFVEKEKRWIDFAKRQMDYPTVEWIHADYSSVDKLPRADIVLASYTLGECDPKKYDEIADKLTSSLKQLLLIIEPGTPRGFETVKRMRDIFIKQGLSLLAPCPHELKCPCLKDDWCHFSERLSRSKEHRILKQATLGYEDEKFSYLIFSKDRIDVKPGERVLSKPQYLKGRVLFKSCSSGGICQRMVTKSNPHYKSLRRVSWGDRVDQNTG